MSYYTLLGLTREPFSSSPDPDFFYESHDHHAVLTRLLIEIRLRRGLSVVLGDVGTGKTTLSRKLFQMLADRPDILFFMVMDPTFQSEDLFLESLIRVFNIQNDLGTNKTILDYKEAIKKYLYQKGVEENRTVVLVVDEAQKLNEMSLEVLRVLLNYETNEFKLLQLVLFGQMELLPRINEMKNFVDRIIFRYVLNPLDKKELKDMIEFRLRQAGFNSSLQLFTDDAIEEIHNYTQGYPRRINLLCHNVLRALITENKAVVDAGMVHQLFARSVV